MATKDVQADSPTRESSRVAVTPRVIGWGCVITPDDTDPSEDPDEVQFAQCRECNCTVM